MCHGTLKDYVEKEGPIHFQMSEMDALLQVTQGLAHLHRLEIVHRDIKPTNILISMPESIAGEGRKPLIKLADFGLSNLLKSDREDFTKSNANHDGDPSGTNGWTAPELYDKSNNRYDFRVDIFPLGCIFGYTLSGGKHPFGFENDDSCDLAVRIKNKKSMLLVQEDLKEPYSSEGSAFELIQTMVDMNPKKRPTADKILMDVFFKTYIDEEENKLFGSVSEHILLIYMYSLTRYLNITFLIRNIDSNNCRIHEFL